MAIFHSFLYVYQRVFAFRIGGFDLDSCEIRWWILHSKPGEIHILADILGVASQLWQAHQGIRWCIPVMAHMDDVYSLYILYIPSDYVKIAIENGPLIVDLPFLKMMIFHSNVNVYQRVGYNPWNHTDPIWDAHPGKTKSWDVLGCCDSWSMCERNESWTKVDVPP